MLGDFQCKHGHSAQWVEAEVKGHSVAFNVLYCDECYKARWFVDSTGAHYDRVTDIFVRVLPENEKDLIKIERDMEE